MLKRVIVERAVSATDGFGADIEVPAGRWWMMEGPAWTTLIWSDGISRQAAEVPARLYDSLRRDGVIRPAGALPAHGPSRDRSVQGDTR